MSFWMRKIDDVEDRINHMPEPLAYGESADEYPAGYEYEAVEELADRGGGFLHNAAGLICKFVAPLPRMK